MFLSNLKEAQAFLSKYLPNAGTYYSSKRNYSYDFENKIHSTSLLSPYIRYRLLSEEDIIKKIINDNPSINFIYLNRNYDKEAWKYSKKGFFNFKKHIPELITKINNERNFKN